MEFNTFLQEKRKELGYSVRQLAKLTGVNYSLYSKFENGLRNPTDIQLSRLAERLGVDKEKLMRLAGRLDEQKTTVKSIKTGDVLGKRGAKFPMSRGTEKENNINIAVPPNTPVLYTDSVYLTVSPYGVVLNFAQHLGSTNQQNIVSRVGMSKIHARILVERLSDLLNKDTSVKQSDRKTNKEG